MVVRHIGQMLLHAARDIVPFACPLEDRFQPVVNGLGEWYSIFGRRVPRATSQCGREAIEEKVLCENLRLMVSLVIAASLQLSSFKHLIHRISVTVSTVCRVKSGDTLGEVLFHENVVNKGHNHLVNAATHMQKLEARALFFQIFLMVQYCDRE